MTPEVCPQRWSQRILGLLLITLFGFPAAAAGPNLVVLVVAEQFRSNYLDQYRGAFSRDGFGRLLSQGAVFPRCRYDHLATMAAPNAATLATGSYPAVHGIVGDRWYERASKQLVDAVRGTLAAPETPTSGPVPISPQYLTGSTFADELRMASRGGSRVVAISDRPAPAVMLGGRAPFACYWMTADGRFETSDYYRAVLPPWVDEFSALHSPLRHQGAAWKALGASEDSPPLRVLQRDSGDSRSGFMRLYRASPFALEQILEFAKRTVEVEKLGQGTHTDLLIVNLSPTSLLGLETGANSPLMRDLIARMDRSLADLLGYLDEQVGLDRTLLIFTGLYGLPPLPEELLRDRQRAGRVQGSQVVERMNHALEAAFGPGVFVEKYVYPFVYLNQKARDFRPEKYRQAIATAGKAAMEIPGVASYYVPGESTPGDGRRIRLGRSWHPPRTGDLLLVYEPFFVEDYAEGRGTTSGSYHRYDTDVPLILWGRRFRTGHYEQDVDAASVAPTLAAALGIAVPSSATGQVLADILVPVDPLPERNSRQIQ